jgi:hypothetical protein
MMENCMTIRHLLGATAQRVYHPHYVTLLPGLPERLQIPIFRKDLTELP